jgi:hypothetical protein
MVGLVIGIDLKPVNNGECHGGNEPRVVATTRPMSLDRPLQRPNGPMERAQDLRQLTAQSSHISLVLSIQSSSAHDTIIVEHGSCCRCR